MRGWDARQAIERTIGGATVLVLLAAPLLFTDYFVGTILTQTLFYGVAAASIIFLTAYGGMVSLAQVAIYGIAGFAVGNMVTEGGSKGLNLGWDPWLAAILGIAIAVAVGFLFGALAGRSAGIYFLMITLTYAVVTYYFFGQVTDLSGFGGVSNILAPASLGRPIDEMRFYYICLAAAALAYVLARYVARTPFGVALQGVRDEPVRMASLGYNVWLHRTLAFTLGAFMAALAGVLFVWWNGFIDPNSIQVQATIDLLVMAVIGGLLRIEGAWLGALAFVLITTYVRDVELPWVGGSFNTVIGLIFLAIVIVSPDGLIGLWDRGLSAVLRARDWGRTRAPSEAS
jgi:branched-chain amino acid transport system permease protein